MGISRCQKYGTSKSGKSLVKKYGLKVITRGFRTGKRMSRMQRLMFSLAKTDYFRVSLLFLLLCEPWCLSFSYTEVFFLTNNGFWGPKSMNVPRKSSGIDILLTPTERNLMYFGYFSKPADALLILKIFWVICNNSLNL